MQVRVTEKKDMQIVTAENLPAHRNDPFVYFANVIRGKIKMKDYDLSAPANNETVIKILEAAKHAARTGETVTWNTFFIKKY